MDITQSPRGVDVQDRSAPDRYPIDMYVVETRELAYFIAVAEERHFGRAAQRLGMAQPPLSRAIRQLEDRLGVTLLERTTRSVRLTSAGTVLLAEGRKALAAATLASEQARRAGDAGSRLRVVTKPEGDAGLLKRSCRATDRTPTPPSST